MLNGAGAYTEEALQKEEAHIAVGPVFIDGILNVPIGCTSVVLFANGSGKRLNQANRFCAKELRAHGMGTFLLELLTPEEELCYRKRFDIDVLTTRLTKGLVWLRGRPDLKNASVGLFGSDTAAAAALKIAARSTDIGAVVTRGGRPDLAASELRFVRCPTLFIAGGRDYDVLRLNKNALEVLSCRKELAVVPEATQGFEEPGALETVSRVAVKWLAQYLKGESAFGGHAQVAAVG